MFNIIYLAGFITGIFTTLFLGYLYLVILDYDQLQRKYKINNVKDMNTEINIPGNKLF